MEKIFTNKSIWKKIVIAILVVMAFQMLLVNKSVFAANEDSQSIGGVLAKPVGFLGTSFGDAVINLLHKFILGQEETKIEITNVDVDQYDNKIQKFLEWARPARATAMGIVSDATKLIGIGNIKIPFLDKSISEIYGETAEALMPYYLYLPVYSYTPEEIFRGNILLFNTNFFDSGTYGEIKVNYGIWDDSTGGWTEAIAENKEKYDNKIETNPGKYRINYYYYVPNDKEDIEENRIITSPQDSARIFKSTVSKWYIAIRNICIVIMLSILVYIGIRMMLTSIASDKAKYKEMFKDWLIGLCLLFVIHYIMSFSNILVDRFTKIIETSKNDELVTVALKDEYEGKLKTAADAIGIDDQYWKDIDGDGKEELLYPTNLMGRLRLESQFINGSSNWLGSVFCYIMLVALTVVFTYTYFKRLLYMTFLTIIAPFVSLTYCIDKVNDGQAQGFNTWLKEYIFNLLIQPLHLLLYFVLITSVNDLAKDNVIYSIAALMFMIPGEKLLRSLFGFEKAKTPPSLVGAITGANLVKEGINRIRNIGISNEKAGNNNQVEASNNNRYLGSGNVNPGNAIWEVVNESSTDAPSTDTPSTDTPSTDTPSTDTPSTDTPSTDTPSTDTPSTDTPSTDTPSTDTPSTDTPSTDTPSTYTLKRKVGNFSTGLKDRFKNMDVKSRVNRVGRAVSPRLKGMAITGTKTLVRGTVGASGAMIAGAWTAATTGDLGRSFQAATEGARAGEAIATSGTRIASNLSSETIDTINDARDAWHGDDKDYKEQKKAKERKKIMRDPQLQNALSKELGEDTMKNMMNNGEVDTYIQNGATNADDIIALHELKKKIQTDKGIKDDKAAAEAAGGVFQFHRDFAGGKDTTTMKDRDKTHKAIRGNYSRNYGDTEADNLTDTTMKWMDYFSEQKFHH